MSAWFKHHYEKLLVGLAAGILAGSVLWTLRQQVDFPSRGEPLKNEVARPLADYTPATWQLPAAAPAPWPEASEQSAGRDWRYDLFTPPAIYYHPRARTFAVTPLAESASAEAGESDAGNEESDDEPFPLQLAGYFGFAGDYVIAFVSPDSPGTLLAHVGRHFEELDLTLKSFEVRKVPVKHDEPWPVYEVAGFATLVDEQMGTEVVLDTRQPVPARHAIAFSNSAPPRVREVAGNGP